MEPADALDVSGRLAPQRKHYVCRVTNQSRSPDQPPPGVRLELAEAVVVAGGTLEYSVVNVGATAVRFGASCGFERPGDTEWTVLPLSGWVAAWAMVVEPGATSGPLKETVPDHLAPGRYRLFKVLQAPFDHRREAPTPTDSTTVTCEFSVQPR